MLIFSRNNHFVCQMNVFQLLLLQIYILGLEYTMQIELTRQVQEAIADFKQLQKNQTLPPLIEIKLTCLQSILEGRLTNEYLIDQLSPYQRLSLEQMNRQTQMNLFTSIVRCFSGRQIIIYFKNQRIYLRKDAGFFSWNKCYLTCDSKKLTIKKKIDSNQILYSMELDKVWISKGHKQYKKKRIFSIYYVDRKHILGFDEQITCNRVHRILAELLSEKRQLSVLKYDNSELLREHDSKKLGMNGSQVFKMIQTQQTQFMLTLQQKVDQSALNNDKDFKLIKNIDQGRLLQHLSNSSIKTNLIIQNIGIVNIAQYFLQFKQWNTSIDSFQILNRPRKNTYIGYLKTTKYSFISYPRDTYLSIIYYESCKCRNANNNNRYLLIQSVEDENENINGGIMRMKYKQIIEFTTRQQKDKLVLMTILTDIDFKGYSYTAEDNKEMTLHLLKDINNFAKFCQEQYINGNHIKYFQTIPCDCNFENRNSRQQYGRSYSDVSLPTQRTNDQVSEVQQKQLWQSQIKVKYIQGIATQRYVIKALHDIQNKIPNQDILQIMNSKKHYSYALKHRFSNIQDVFKNTIGNNSDFLTQQGRWKFEGDQYIFCDAQVLAAQKDIIKMIIKQLSSNLFAGKSIMNMSLPVEIFARRSMLDLIAASFGFLPHYLSKAVACTNPVQQMKYIVAAFMFMSATCPNIEKPFNPILGETFQGMIGNIPIVLEQISHHPPISSIFIKTKQFFIYGNMDIVVNMGLNTVQSKVLNWLRAEIYTTNTNYYIKMPDIQLAGMMYGNRTLRISNKGYVFERNNNILCEYSIGKQKKRVYESTQKLKAADLSGGIFKVKSEFGDKIVTLDRKKNFDGLKAEDIVETYCFLSGKWYGDLFFDKISYKSMTDGPFPQKPYRQKYLLASDSIFRQDIIFKIWDNNERSNQQKQRLQNIQRNDKKLRGKHKK